MDGLPPTPILECVLQEARKQALDPFVILAVMRHEAGKDGDALKNKNGSYDLGRMGMNTVNIPEIARVAGYEPTADNFYKVATTVMNNGCANIAAGAWMIAKWRNLSGGDIWHAVGRYHAPYNERLADIYRQKVRKEYVAVLEKFR